MKVDRATVVTLFSTELRTVLRDKRTVIMSIVLPLLVMPLMLYAGRWSEQRRAAKLVATEYTYAVTGAHADSAREAIAAAPAAALEKVGGGGLREPNAQRFKEVPATDAAAALEAGDLHFYLETASGKDAAARAAAERAKEKPADTAERSEGEAADAERDESEMDSGGEPALPGVPAITVVYRADRDASETGARTMRDRLRDARRELRDVTLRERGLPVAPKTVGAVATADVATAAEVTGLKLGRFATLFLLLFVLSGGAVVATDTLAGEKERGTLETLLTTAVTRREVIVAKLLLILAVALMITLIQVANLLVYVGFKLVPAPENFAAAITPARAMLLLVLYLPVIALASSVLLLTSGRAKTYKEAQLYFFPVFLLGLIPTLAPMLPGVRLRSVIALVPVANIAVAVKEVLVGMPDWPMIAVAWVVTAAAAVGVGMLAEKALSTERLITAADVGAEELRGGPALFPRHVLRWFAVLWAILFAVANNMGENADIRLQLLVNLGVLFLGGSFLMIRRYRLHLREALALRAPRPAVWLAVLVGAPAGLVAATGVFRPRQPRLPGATEDARGVRSGAASRLHPVLAARPAAHRGTRDLRGDRLPRRAAPRAAAALLAGGAGARHRRDLRLLPRQPVPHRADGVPRRAARRRDAADRLDLPGDAVARAQQRPRRPRRPLRDRPARPRRLALPRRRRRARARLLDRLAQPHPVPRPETQPPTVTPDPTCCQAAVFVVRASCPHGSGRATERIASRKNLSEIVIVASPGIYLKA